MKNLGRSADVLPDGTGDGIILYDMGRNSRVIQCQAHNCFDFGDSANTPCLT